MCFAKRTSHAALLLALLFTFCACFAKDNPPSQPARNDTITFRGEEYVYLTNESILYPLGELVFEGSESQDPDDDYYWEIQSGIYSFKCDDDYSVLIRRVPDNEWGLIYRKASLPPFDFSLDNCSRLELVPNCYYLTENAVHITCGEGMTDRAQIAEFLSDVRSQKHPKEAGLYDLVPKDESGIGWVPLSPAVYGFFEEEPNLVLIMYVSSYDNQAYSIQAYSSRMKRREYVLPEEWMELLRGH